MNCKRSSDIFPIATKRSGTLLHFELDVWWAGRLHISIHTEEAQVPSVMIRGKVASKRFWRGNENEQCFPGIFLEWRMGREPDAIPSAPPYNQEYVFLLFSS